MPQPKVIYDVVENNNNGEKKVPFPYEIKKVNTEINQQLLRDFTGEKTGFVQVGPTKWFFPSKYEQEAANYYNFEVRPNDVWIVTYPRSGTTWTQEMIWLLANNLDYQKAMDIPLTERFPFLEFSIFVHDETKKEFLQENSFCPERMQLVEEISKPAWKTLSETSERRFIKTHLPFSLLPPNLLEVGCKVVYIARNPKDVAVSFYHLNRLIRTQGYQGNFEKYWYYFKNNLQPWSPYWNHIEEGWEQRNKDNLLFLFYEDMNKDLRGGIEKVSQFLGTKLNNQELDKLEKHLQIENFRKNKSVNYDILKELGILIKGEEGFVRKGVTQGWKDYFTKELDEEANEWIEENMKLVGIKFPKNSTNN